MPLPISAILPPAGIRLIEIAPKSQSATGAFQSYLSDAIGQVQQAQDTSNATADRFLAGENEEVHTVAIETQKAELQFEMFLAVRNKVVSAYQEVMKMQM